MRRAIGLDVGDKRIGVAVSDPLGITAQSLMTIESKGWDKDIQSIMTIARQYETDLIVAGYPRLMSGVVGAQARSVELFAERLRAAGAEVVLSDERLTSKSARNALIEGGASRKKQKQSIDKIAAALILQNFIDSGGLSDNQKNGPADGMEAATMQQDMERDNVVELVDENGGTVSFEHLMTIEHNGDAYVLLAGIESSEDLGDDEVLILKIEEDEFGDETYVGVEDEALLEEIFEKYLAIAEADEDDGGDVDEDTEADE